MVPGVCAHLGWDTPFGCPASSGNAAALPDSLQVARSQDAALRGCTQTDRRHCWEMGSCFPWEMGSCFPQGVRTYRHHPRPAPASGLCIKQTFFSDMASSTSASRGPVRSRSGGSALHPTTHPQGAWPSGTPLSPAPQRSPWFHTPGSERLFTVRPWPQQRLAHLQKRLKRGTAARRCGDGVAWQKHAVPGAAGLAGLGWEGGSQSRGAPRSSLAAILPAWPWGSPGSLRNKLIQITAREIYTRREPLPAAVLWAGAPAVPCPGRRLSPTSGPPLATIKSSRQQNSDSL